MVSMVASATGLWTRYWLTRRGEAPCQSDSNRELVAGGFAMASYLYAQ